MENGNMLTVLLTHEPGIRRGLRQCFYSDRVNRRNILNSNTTMLEVNDANPNNNKHNDNTRRDYVTEPKISKATRDNTSFNDKSISVVYWNVNGLGDMLGEPDVISLLNKYDVIVMSETMKRPTFKVSFTGYTSYHYPHERQSFYKNRAPGGFIVLVKNLIANKCVIVKQDAHVVWLHLKHASKRSNDYFIGCVYLPHEKSTLKKIDHFESLQNDVLNFKSKGNVIIFGDTNSRTGNLDDYTSSSSHDNMNYILNDLYDVSSRQNCDSLINSHGKKLILFCKETGMQIQNGRFGSSSNRFTCYRYNGKSQIDYLITYPSVTRNI